MYNKLIFILFSAFILSFPGCSSRIYIPAENGVRESVSRRIEDRNFTININSVQGRRNAALAPRYSLSVDGDMVSSFLPFFGRAGNIPYGGGDGLIFEGQIYDYSSVFREKDSSYNIDFKVRTDEDQHQFSINIFPNGYSYVHVSSLNRENIDFTGNMDF